MIDSAEELVKKDAQGTTIGYLRPYAALHKNKKCYMRTSKEAEWISNVDMLIKQCRISDRAASLAQGDYFEEVAAAAARLCVGSAENWLVDATTGAVQSFVGKAVGHRREAMHFRLDGMNLKEYERVFAQRLTEQQIQTDGKGNRYMVINDYSQGKIDVEAFFPVYQ